MGSPELHPEHGAATERLHGMGDIENEIRSECNEEQRVRHIDIGITFAIERAALPAKQPEERRAWLAHVRSISNRKRQRDETSGMIGRRRMKDYFRPTNA
mmetsp:Transcript_49155/g.73294  ORF Transcript_49155/g.73294 Transcript_49155/m.73294 type:complete len:100 (-) Transcript_49155:99-398(-)